MSNNGMYWLGVVLITIGLSVLFTRKDNQQFDHSLDLNNMNVNGAIQLNVRTSSGNIDITKNDRNEVDIRTDVKVRSFVPFEARRITRQIKQNPPIEQNGNDIVVGDMSKYRFGPGFLRSISIDYEIETPFETEVLVSSSSGNQSIKDIAGPIRSKASSGNISIENIVEDISTELSSGNVTIEEVDGNLSVKLSSGNLKLNDIAGNITSKQSSGNTTLKDVAGSLDISTTSGNINLDSDLPNNANWSFKATSGDVELNVPDDSDFKLDINVTSGNISWGDFELVGQESDRSTTGFVGNSNASSSLKVSTTSGDIRFE